MPSQSSYGVVTPTNILSKSHAVQGSSSSAWTLSNGKNESAEVILDYGRCEGGIPVFTIESATSQDGKPIAFRTIYSETRDGIDHEQGDGPFFLFSNGMDTYRTTVHQVSASEETQQVRARFLQGSQRYQRIVLLNPETSITFSDIGFERTRPEAQSKGKFHCSDPALNRIWQDGVRTVDLCTVQAGETLPAWDMTKSGVRIYGSHWAPCRQGTRWTDKTVRFEAKAESLGLSWGIHMVANGLVFCLDTTKRTLDAFEGLSNQSAVFPAVPKGSWDIPSTIDLNGWLTITSTAEADKVSVDINGSRVADVSGLDIHPILGGSCNNSGSVAFGNPPGWVSIFRNLEVTAHDNVLYENTLLPTEAERTMADFQVGTNKLACTIDGAKRDRACFGGDSFVSGRSIAYSTGDYEAWKGSLQLLLSHQTEEGYIGNLCPIQAPEHETSRSETPTYAFYSLTYALLTCVAVKDYWLHSGDRAFVDKSFATLQNQMAFTKKFVNGDGLVQAPPPLSMTWFPMGGPVFGVSAGVNLAYLDALQAMAFMAQDAETQSQYSAAASALQESIRSLWNTKTNTMRLSPSLPEDGTSQDVLGLALKAGLGECTANSTARMLPADGSLPPAFQGLGHWDKTGVSSPYASGFALEALLAHQKGADALNLLSRVWGPMADPSTANYSGAHWEALRLDGTPFNHDVSLAHAWSTWPVFLMPQYLAGVRPLEPGWKSITVEPVLSGLESVDYSLHTPSGPLSIQLKINETELTVTLNVAKGVKANLKAPPGWTLQATQELVGTGQTQTASMVRSES